MKSTLLLVDDQDAARRLLRHALAGDYQVREASDRKTAMRAVSEGGIDLVVLDLHLPPDLDTPSEGLRLQRDLARTAPALPVIITTGDQDRGIALEMVRAGVADFLLKPFDPVVLKIVVSRALERARLEREVLELKDQIRERFSFGSLVGRSLAMRAVFDRLVKLAPARTTVLLLGESGTGKSAFARALHQSSPRSGRPFVVVDGATIPEPLLEKELFGHVRGAFTGADASKTGRIQAADGGTLFLDEIGNLSPAAQGKLLLFLDNRTYNPVGSNEETRADVRLIAATNRDLERLVADGRFREDLFFRIAVATVVLPPLRERREDIPSLAEYLLASVARENGRARAALSPGALDMLEAYPWPGNVRQLRHVLEASLVLAQGETLEPADLVLPVIAGAGRDAARGAPAAPGAPALSLKDQLSGLEREMLQRAIEECGGNKAAAGRSLGLDENQVRYLCRKHGLT